MNLAELRSKSKDELNEMVTSVLGELFQLKMHKAMSENPKTHMFKSLRKDIARIKTVLNENKSVQ